MPRNKNAVIRYRALDKCFSDFRHRYYIEDLIEEEESVNRVINEELIEFKSIYKRESSGYELIK